MSTPRALARLAAWPRSFRLVRTAVATEGSLLVTDDAPGVGG